MAKQKQLRMLTGGMNVLNPGDKLPAGDCLQLENWRVDQDGALRSRAGRYAAFAPNFFHAAHAPPNPSGQLP